MDARSLFAFLAVILLFWLIYTWIRWDSQERLARQSRQRLRDKLFDVTLSERVGNRDTVALLAAASAHSISRSGRADAGGLDEATALNNNGLPEQHESQTIGDSTQSAEAPSGKAPEKVYTPIFEAPSEKDDLKKIKGIGPVMERTLNALGVTTFQQLADFTQEDIDKVSEAIDAFPGRIERDDWCGKARQILQKNKGTA